MYKTKSFNLKQRTPIPDLCIYAETIINRFNFVHSLNKYKQFSSCGYHKLIVLSASKC